MIVFKIMVYLGGILQLAFWGFWCYLIKIEKKSRDKPIMIPRKKLKFLFFFSVALLGIGIIGGLTCRFFF